jgi:hypothetical protein
MKHRPMTPAETDTAIGDATFNWLRTTVWAVLAVRSRAFRAERGNHDIYRNANLTAKHGPLAR